MPNLPIMNLKAYTCSALLLLSLLAAPAQAQRRRMGAAKAGATATQAQPRAAVADASLNDRPVPLPKGVTPYIEKEENGQINWTQQFIEAEGEGIIDNERFKNPAQARAMAIRGATVVAQRNLLEIVKGVTVTSETTVEDLIATSDKIITRIEGVVKGAQMVGQPVVADGSVRVRLRMPLYASNGLAPAVADVTPAPVGPTPTGDSAVQLANQPAGNMPKAPEKGLAFNLNGKPFDPALFPVVTDSAGNVLLDTRQIYDPTKGKFPQVVNATRQVLEAAGFKKGVEVIDVISAKDGKIVIDNKGKSKFPWDKVLNTVKTVGKFLLMLL